MRRSIRSGCALLEQRLASWFLALAASAAVLSACNKEHSPTAEQPQGSVGSATASVIQSSAATDADRAGTPAASGQRGTGSDDGVNAAAATSSVSESNFELRIAPKGTCEVDKPAQAEIVLEAKPPFHVNDKYPYKFKLKEEANLAFPAPVVSKEAVTLEKSKVTMAVPFTAKSPGPHHLAGQFAFSICTEDKCLIEKRDLVLAVNAK
jgi:hypothetical protein